jgi:hypothetical protein
MWEIKPQQSPEPELEGQRSGVWKWLVAGLVALIGLGVGFWYWNSSQKLASAPPLAVAAMDAGTGGDAGYIAAEQISDGDAILRQMGATLSTAPELKSWLSANGLIRRLASAVNLIADGDSPAEVLGFLAPKGKFEVERKPQMHAAPSTYARYDTVTRVLTSIDVLALGKVYRAVLPYLRSAYAEVGRPDKTFETALRAALDKMLATPIPESDPILKEHGLGYVYVDPKLESLSAAQKHLLRTGPANSRALQKWGNALRAELFSDSPH